MKPRLSAVLVIILLMPLSGATQVLVGVKAGWNASLPVGNGNAPPGTSTSVDRNSWLVEIFAQGRPEARVICFGVAAQYYSVGLSGVQTSGGHGAGTTTTYSCDLHYLNVLFKPEFVFGSRWKFIINTGVYVSMLLRENITGTWQSYGPPPGTSGTIDGSEQQYVQPITVGLLGGIGTEYPIFPRIILMLEADCTTAFSGFSRALNPDFTTLVNFQLTVGVAYRFGWNLSSQQEKKRVDWYQD